MKDILICMAAEFHLWPQQNLFNYFLLMKNDYCQLYVTINVLKNETACISLCKYKLKIILFYNSQYYGYIEQWSPMLIHLWYTCSSTEH